MKKLANNSVRSKIKQSFTQENPFPTMEKIQVSSSSKNLLKGPNKCFSRITNKYRPALSESAGR